MPTTYTGATPATIATKFGIMPDLVNDFGADRSGSTDNSTLVTNAIASVASVGRSPYLKIPTGCQIAVNHITMVSGVTLIGDGQGSVLKFIGTPSSGIGRIDIPAGVSGWALENFAIDGGVTTPVGIDYASLSGNPLTASLTTGSSIWVHGGSGSSNGLMDRVRITHTGGYSVLFDATAGSMSGMHVRRCKFYDNRPHTFGVSGSFIYGGWTSGIHYESNGSSASVDDLLVELCTFLRMSGHCFWGHAAALSLLNSNIRFNNNFCQDHALDMCEMGAVNGFQVRGNRSSRGGYLSSTDGAVGVPKWGTVTPAIIDHTGLCINGDISNNTLDAVNGTAIDGDGLTSSSITGNTCTSSWGSSDPNAASGSCGPLGSGSNVAPGINPGNSNGNAGGSYLNITSNTFTGFGAGAIRLYGARNCKVTGNTINHPSNAVVGPISGGPVGTASYQRCTNNDISGNSIFWVPGSTGSAVTEDSNGGAHPFVSTDINLVNGNRGAGNFYEFFKDPGSSSTTGPLRADSVTASATDATTAGKRVGTIVQTEGISLAAHAFKEYRSDGTLLRTSTILTTDIPSVTVSGNGAISNIRDFTGHSLAIYSAAHPLVIDNAANVFGNSVTINGAAHALALDNVANAFLNSVSINGAAHPIVLDAAANGFLNSVTINGATTPLVIDNAANGAFRSMLVANNVTSSAGGFAVGSTGVITNARDFYSNSLSVGSTPTIAASAAGLALANDRTAYLSQVYIGANGASPTLVIDNTGAYVGPISLHPTTTIGTVGSTATNISMVAASQGANDNVHDYSPFVSLLGSGAPSARAMEEHFYPYASVGLAREAAVSANAYASSSDTNWETDAFIGRMVSNRVGRVCTVASLFGLSNAGTGTTPSTMGNVEGLNIFLRDYDNNNQFTTWPSVMVGIECDIKVAHLNSAADGINIGLDLKQPTSRNSYTNKFAAVNIDLTNGDLITWPHTASDNNYFDYGIVSHDGAARCALHCGVIDVNSGSGSQFIELQSGGVSTSAFSGTTPVYLAKIYTGSNGTISFWPNSANQGLGMFITKDADVLIDGRTGQPSLALSNGYMQSSEGFYSTSSLTNVLNIPNGGAKIGGEINVGIAPFNNTTIISAVTPTGNGTVFGFNAHNSGFGTYSAVVSSNRSSYWEMGNGGVKLVVTSNTQTAGASLSTATTAISVDFFGNVALGAGLSIAGSFNPSSIAASGNITSGANISCLGSFSTVSGFVTASLVGANTFQANSGTVIDSGRNAFFTTLTINFAQVIDGGRNIVNAGSGTFSGAINCVGLTSTGAGINIGSQGIACGGISILGSFGQTRTIQFVTGGFTVSGGGGTVFTRLIMSSGVLTNWS